MSVTADLALGFWLRARSHTCLPVAGESMSPFLRPGWSVQVEHTVTGLRRGDVIAYRAGDRVVVHRLVHLLADGSLLTRGDRRLGFDPPVAPAQVIGRVVAVVTPRRTINLAAPGWRALQSLLGWTSWAVGCLATRGRR